MNTLYEIKNTSAKNKNVSVGNTLRFILPASITCLVFSFSAPAFSQHNEHNEEKHIAGIFQGATINEDGDAEYTYGLEYEFKLSPQWGAGIVYERANLPEEEEKPGHHEHHDSNDYVEVILAAGYYHINSFRLGMGIGQEDEGKETENLVRIGGEYEFHVNGFGISPGVNFDIVDGEANTVLGVTFSKAF